ncbi:MAG: uroporphyrinogen-III synthase [Anaerolineae bacterium]|nr:uroporphyrinogen-III synthase [Anaerolineae bacterium]
MSGALRDKRIVNTRALHQAQAFDDLIAARGAQPLSYPCIAIQPSADSRALDAALQQLDQFDWLVITSANTVMALAARAEALGIDLARYAALRVGAIGPATAEAARTQLGLTCDLMPEEYIAEALAETLRPIAGARIFLPESAIARPTLAQMLTEAGAEVTVVTAYETVCGSGGVDLPALLAQGAVDAVTFTSSSTVRCFVERLPDDAALDGLCMACIGPKTARTAHEYGLKPVVSAATHTLEGILDALAAYYRSQDIKEDTWTAP